MKVRELIEQLGKFEPDLEVHLLWPHGAEPGPVSKVVEDRYGDQVRIVIRPASEGEIISALLQKVRGK